MRFSDSYDLGAADVLFLCSAHGKSKEFWEQNERPAGLKVIDLAQDFRDESDGYVYGLPEWQRERIRGAEKIANPGCFATAIQLALLPLASAGLLDGPVRVTAITGSTGAGVKPSATTHVSWRSNNLSTYKVFEHQHLLEIRRTLGRLQPGFDSPVQFVPMRGDFARGIFASVTAECPLSGDEALALYRDFYADAAFTFVSDRPVDLKQVVNTNKCIVALEKHDGLQFEAVKMERDKVYNIPATLWHNTVTCRDTKMILIEDSSTSNENSDVLALTPGQIEQVRALAQ